MSNLSPHIKELSKTLNPLYGPETPTAAVNRLLGFYQRLDEAEQLRLQRGDAPFQVWHLAGLFPERPPFTPPIHEGNDVLQ